MRHRRKPRIFFPFLIVGIVALLGLIVMQLWNSILPQVTGFKTLTYWQAVGLLILCRILFGSFRPGGSGFRRGAAWREKMMNMTPEDKARFKAEWQARRFGHRQSPENHPAADQ